MHNLKCDLLDSACLDEDLIKWGWPEDVWFHVDKYSSAHVYLRLQHVSSIIIISNFLLLILKNNTVILFEITGSDNR